MIFNQQPPTQGGGSVETWTLSFRPSVEEDESMAMWQSDDYGSTYMVEYPGSVTTTTACPVCVTSWSGDAPLVFDAQGNEVSNAVTQVDSTTFLVSSNVHEYGTELFIGFE